MAKIDEKRVLAKGAVIVWEGITRPDTTPQGDIKHNLKVALRPGSPEIAELQALATAALVANSEMQGTLPPGGNWPLIVLEAGEKTDPTTVGFTAFNAKTGLGAPQVFDVNGQLLNAMQYGSMLYAGAIVDILVSAYSFTNKSKGVAFSLDGVRIVDATTPKLSIAAGFDASSIFGAPGIAPTTVAPPVGAPVAPPVAAPPVAAPVSPVAAPPAHDFLNPGAPGAPAAAAPIAPAPAASGPVMTALTGGQPYQSFIDAGWNDAQLREKGYMI